MAGVSAKAMFLNADCLSPLVFRPLGVAKLRAQIVLVREVLSVGEAAEKTPCCL